MKKYFFALVFLFASCGQKKENTDEGFAVTKTTNVTKANATKEYSVANRKGTQHEIEKTSVQEKGEAHIIKVSKDNIIFCDDKDNIQKEFSISKQWIDSTGPSTVYDLKDKNGGDYSLDHYFSYDKTNYFRFRFGKFIETYSGKAEEKK